MTDQMLRKIDKIRTLLASAGDGGMRALDKETVTAALRDLYDEVLSVPVVSPSFSAEEPMAQPPRTEPEEPAAESEAGSVAEPEEGKEGLFAIAVEAEEVKEPQPGDEETVIIASADDVAGHIPHDPVEEITMSAEPVQPTRMERMLSDERSLAALLGEERLGTIADELCHGDMEACLDMMESIEATGDFDMAVLYIQDHYPQKSDGRAIDMLVEALSAKFI